jgi:hypothetical protein
VLEEFGILHQNSFVEGKLFSIWKQKAGTRSNFFKSRNCTGVNLRNVVEKHSIAEMLIQEPCCMLLYQALVCKLYRGPSIILEKFGLHVN